VGWGDYAEVAAAALLMGVRVGVGERLVVALHRAGGLAHGLGQGDQIVGRRRRGRELAVVPHQLPPTGGGQAAGMLLAQVVRVRLGKCRQRPHNSRAVVVDIGQRGDGLAGAAVSGAAPW
jgi:hypothetical protein